MTWYGLEGSTAMRTGIYFGSVRGPRGDSASPPTTDLKPCALIVHEGEGCLKNVAQLYIKKIGDNVWNSADLNKGFSHRKLIPRGMVVKKVIKNIKTHS